MPNSARVPLSILDLAFVREGDSAREALQDSRDLDRNADHWGYNRFWMAEHHNMEGIASAATSVALAYIAEGTERIRIGSGGIMLPNHSPLVIAEQFGTLASIYPGRVDLGLGRAPGTDMRTARALRRVLGDSADAFPDDVQELLGYFGNGGPGQMVHAYPGEGLHVPIWILGSSTYGAELAGLLGLPYAFASHFAPDLLLEALDVYRKNFRPSSMLEKPYTMVAANVIVAESDEEADFLFSSAKAGVMNLLRGKRGKMTPPVENVEQDWTEAERAGVDGFLRCSFIGSPDKVKAQLDRFVKLTGADELISTARIYSQEARLRSFELLGQCWLSSAESQEVRIAAAL